MHVIWTHASICPRSRTLVPYYVSTEPASGFRQIYLDNLEKQQFFSAKELKQLKSGLKGGKNKYISSSSSFFLISWDQSTGSTFLGKDSWSCHLSLSHCSALMHSLSTWQVRGNRSSEAQVSHITIAWWYYTRNKYRQVKLNFNTPNIHY